VNEAAIVGQEHLDLAPTRAPAFQAGRASMTLSVLAVGWMPANSSPA
jgi:hypothetical protein